MRKTKLENRHVRELGLVGRGFNPAVKRAAIAATTEGDRGKPSKLAEGGPGSPTNILAIWKRASGPAQSATAFRSSLFDLRLYPSLMRTTQ